MCAQVGENSRSITAMDSLIPQHTPCLGKVDISQIQIMREHYYWWGEDNMVHIGL